MLFSHPTDSSDVCTHFPSASRSCVLQTSSQLGGSALCLRRQPQTSLSIPRMLLSTPNTAPAPSAAFLQTLQFSPQRNTHASHAPTSPTVHPLAAPLSPAAFHLPSLNAVRQSPEHDSNASPFPIPRSSKRRKGPIRWQPLLTWLLLVIPALWSPPTPEQLAPLGLNSLGSTATVSQAAAGLTDEQQLVADVWKRVDKLFLDRTFNGQDWFALRQAALKKPYKTTAQVYEGIKAMLEPLGDPYTRFLPPSQYDSLFGLATGSVAGVGVSLQIDPATQELTAAEVEKGSPAEAAGLRAGDKLLYVDGQATTGLLVDDCANLLRGPAGTKVGVVARGKGGESKDVIITRQLIKIQSVEALTANKGGKKVGVIRIRSFSQTTADTVAAELEKLEKEGISAVVIDLRGNPGGFLGGGIDTARLFLPAYEKIVSVVGKTGIVEEYQTTDEGRETTKPLFVVVDKRTASASEVLSAALKENSRAKLVGEKTFGKGVVQTIEQVGQNAGVSVTIAAYSTPLGNNINKKGIDVDIPSTCEATDKAVQCLPEGVL